MIGSVQIRCVLSKLVRSKHELYRVGSIVSPHAPLYLGIDAHVDFGGIEHGLTEPFLQFGRVISLHTFVHHQRKAGVIFAVLPRSADHVQPIGVELASRAQVT